jgi:hypothetical protein
MSTFEIAIFIKRNESVKSGMKIWRRKLKGLQVYFALLVAKI